MKQQLQAYARSLAKDIDQLLDMNTTLREDIQQLLNAFNDNWSNQVLRRTVVRACWAHIEAVTFGMKQMTLKASTLGSANMDAEEQQFPSEESFQVDSGGKVRVTAERFDTKKNIKRALKLAGKRFDVAWKPDFGGRHWELLNRSLLLRYRLTHPKSSEDLHVTDTEIDTHREAFLWFAGIFTAFLESLLQRYVDSDPDSRFDTGATRSSA